MIRTKLGHFLHRSPTGRLIVKMVSRKLPKLGSRVVDCRGRLVGKVVDVIGPVDSPYAVVRPVRPDVNLKLLEEVYVRPKSRRRFRK